MKIAFFYPAKIVTCECPHELTPYGSTRFLTSTKKLYFNSEKGKLTFEVLPPDMVQVLVQIFPDTVGVISCTYDLPALVEKLAGDVEILIPRWQDQLDNPEQYERDAAATRTKIKAENAARDAAQAEERERRARAAQTAYENDLKAFATSNGELSPDDFERACKENGVKLPIQTIGWIREHITAVSRTGCKARGKIKHNSPHFWDAVKALSAALQSPELSPA